MMYTFQQNKKWPLMNGFVVQGHIFGYLIVDTYFYYFYI